LTELPTRSAYCVAPPAVQEKVTLEEPNVEPGTGVIITAAPVPGVGVGVPVGLTVALGVGVGVVLGPGVGVGVGVGVGLPLGAPYKL
jgi:hypothetical protein